ncbi:MAG: phytanoyl-CoA dioxygenase family protein [Pseudomonadota bacterium]
MPIITSAEINLYHEQGYLILPDLLNHEQMGSARSRLRTYLQGQNVGRNDFEGYKTERVHGLLGKAEIFGDFVAHPQVLRLLDRVLERNYLLSSCSAVLRHPRETPQVWYYEDDYVRLERPRVSMSIGVFWALDEFNEENCALELIPNSHTWNDEETPWGNDRRRIIVNMPPGSALVANGLLLHRCGSNRSEQDCLLVTTNYCQPWMRQHENLLLSIPLEMVRRYPRRIQELIGYNQHSSIVGHVDGKHPKTLLE